MVTEETISSNCIMQVIWSEVYQISGRNNFGYSPKLKFSSKKRSMHLNNEIYRFI